MPRIAQITPNPDQGLSTLSLKQAAYRAGSRGAETGAMIQGAFNAVGSDIKQFGETVGQQQKTDYLSKYTQWEANEDQEFEKAKQSADPLKPTEWLSDYLDKRQQRLDDFNSQFDGELWGTGAKDYQQQVNQQGTLAAVKSAQAYAGAMHADAQVASAESAANAIAFQWAKDPLNGQQYLDKLDSQVVSVLPPEHRATEAQRLKQETANAVGGILVKSITDNPNATADQIDAATKVLTDENNPLTKTMSPAKVGEELANLAKLKSTLGAANQQIAEQQLPDILRSIKMGGSVDAYRQGTQLISQHVATSATPEGRRDAEVWKAKNQRELDDAMAEGRVTSGLMDKSDDDLNKLKQQAQVAQATATTDDQRRGAEATLRAVENIHTLRDAEFNRDPATYSVNHSPVVNTAAQAFAKTPNADTWGDYAAKQSAYQKQIKGDGYTPRLATKEMDSEVSNAMLSITKDANGTANASAVLAKWSGITGRYWPNLAQEWMQRHILNQDQYAASTIIGKPGAAGLIDPLLSSSRMSENQRFDLHGIGAYKARGAAVKSTQPLAVSLANIPNAAATVEAYTTAVTHLLQVRGETPSSDTASKLANALVLDEYDFKDGGTLRIEKGVGDADKIDRGAGKKRNDIGVYQIDVPQSDRGLGAGDQRSLYVTRLQQNAHWYATPDGKGATLYPSPGASTPVTVKGKPLTLSWKQLQDMGQ